MGPEWGRITIRDIALAINGILVAGKDEKVVTGISTDSRSIKKGEIFWALKGERFDGHDYIDKAFNAGASGVVICRKDLVRRNARAESPVIYVRDTEQALGELASWWRKGHRAKIAGITGSAGKTTTKEMAALIFDVEHQVLKNQGNLNNLIGLPMTLLRLEGRHGRAVVEMGMNRPGEIARLTQIADPDVGLITNVGKAHLEGLGDLLGVARAKLELAQHMRPEAQLILNGDDRILMECASNMKNEFFTFGLGTANYFRAANARVEESGMNMIDFLVEGVKKAEIRIRVPGKHNVMNALGAASIAWLMGERPEAITKGIEQFKGVDGRFVVRKLGHNITLIDDTYNANPLSLRAALDSLNDMLPTGHSLIIGLADMLELGDETEQLHHEAGQWVARLNPRIFVVIGELGKEMARGAVEYGMPSERVMVARDTVKMAEIIKKNLREGDTVFLKGSRLMCLDQVIGILSK